MLYIYQLSCICYFLEVSECVDAATTQYMIEYFYYGALPAIGYKVPSLVLLARSSSLVDVLAL